MKKMKTALLAVTALLLIIAMPAQALTTLGFGCITNNIAGDAAIGEAQLFVDVEEVSGQVLFTFRNTGPEPSSITQVYFDDRSPVLSGIAGLIDADEGGGNPGVDFSPGAGPVLPGGNNAIPPFIVTDTLSAGADPPVQPNGVNPGESLGVLYDLQVGKTFDDVLADLASGNLRIGIHVQGFASGGSESFITPGEPPEVGITIIKDASPADGTNFNFTGDLSGFTLDDAVPDDTDGVPSSKTFSDLNPGTYSVTEIVSNGWDLANMYCSDPDDETTVDLVGATATIDLDAGETVVCIFTNVKPTAITLPSSSFMAEAGAGGVSLAWETGTEMDNAGFNIYRALLKDGPYTKINDALITAQGDAVSGASYSFLDTPDYGTFYYKLEDMDLYGMSTLHGPVKVTVARPFRRPLYRPSLPEF